MTIETLEDIATRFLDALVTSEAKDPIELAIREVACELQEFEGKALLSWTPGDCNLRVLDIDHHETIVDCYLEDAEHRSWYVTHGMRDNWDAVVNAKGLGEIVRDHLRRGDQP